MKTIFRIIAIALLSIPPFTAAITVDGIADAAYGAPIVVQHIGTGFGNNTNTSAGPANGSELDAAYGVISNGVLYLVFAGNFESNHNHLEVFLQTGAGGQNTLTNINPGIDFGHLNNMAGLTFDADFAPNYYISANVGAGTPNPMFVNYAALWPVSDGHFLGQTTTGNATLTGGTNPFGIQASFNNSNIDGVTASGCFTNALGDLESIAAADVTTGVEFAIPLGAIGSPTNTIRVCAFINNPSGTFLSNQILGPILTNGCIGNLGNPAVVNFEGLPGPQHFELIVPEGTCSYSINPLNASHNSNGGTGNIEVTTQTGCEWTAESDSAWITITGGASGTGSGTVNYSVATNTSHCARSGTITAAGQTFSISQEARPFGSIIIDGTAESAYGCPIVVQSVGTGFGDSTNGLVDVANGSELDAAFGTIREGILYLVFAGNLEANFNKLEIFLETGPGGVSTLSTNNPDVDFNGLNRMGTAGNGAAPGNPGLTFDNDFAPTYWLGVAGGGSPYALHVNYAQLWPGGTNENGVATNGYFVGSTPAVQNGLAGGNNPFCIQATINNSNTNGVGPWADEIAGCYAEGGALNPGNVRTGVELAIPLEAIGSPTGAVKVAAFINGQGHDFVSNQILGPFWDGTETYCIANWGEPSDLPLNLLPGQHWFHVGPEMRVTAIARSGNDVNLSWQTQANSNLLYQVERTTALTNNTSWNNIGSPTNGTGTVITLTDPGAGADPAFFYRVREIPQCQP